MRRVLHGGLATLAILSIAGCQLTLKRPDVVPGRMIEPELVEPAARPGRTADAIAVRLVETQARGHIGRRVLHREAGGELTQDPVWQWSSAPDRYLDTALRVELAANAGVRLVDSADASTVGVTLLAWHLESASAGNQLIGAVEVQVTSPDHSVRTDVVRAAEPVSATLPGDLAAAAGRLLQRLASETLARVSRSR